MENSKYAQIFDRESSKWTNNADYNWAFLRNIQSYCTDVLKLEGSLLLNKVYELLGLPKTKMGEVVGWIYNKDNPVGDNFVDFNLIGQEGQLNYVLDFNVDGQIIEIV